MEPKVVSFWTFAGPGIAGSLAMIAVDAVMQGLYPKAAQGLTGGIVRAASFWGAAIVAWKTIHLRNGSIIV